MVLQILREEISAGDIEIKGSVTLFQFKIPEINIMPVVICVKEDEEGT